MTTTTAMVLAAGRGERLRPLTDERPKALVEVRGVSLLEAQLERLSRAGVQTVVINLGWLGEMIVERIGDGSQFGLQVAYSPEYDHVLETGGGILRALPLLGDAPFWVLNADVFTDISLPSVDLAPDCLGHLILVPLPDYLSRGDFDLAGGKVRRHDNPAFVFSGMAVYRPEFFQPGFRMDAEAARFPLAPMLFAAADLGRLSGEIYRGAWADVGTAERLSRLNSDVRS
ncbi:MAG TPA: nucleotidyltransferase family protein [Woeseiaceae bacterium]|nr:nucleotidyltransferase family protein [Woeseiaceae bacterium]